MLMFWLNVDLKSRLKQQSAFLKGLLRDLYPCLCDQLVSGGRGWIFHRAALKTLPEKREDVSNCRGEFDRTLLMKNAEHNMWFHWLTRLFPEQGW